MIKLTYLLGAGASANALPINRKINSSGNVTYFSDELKSFINDGLKLGTDEATINSLRKLLPPIEEMGTPDLSAKLYLETGQNDKYKLLVRLLSNFFSYKHQISNLTPEIFGKPGKKEPRALAFLTSIAEKRRLPNNINILSWNYDSLIEDAAKELSIIHSGENASIEGFSSWPNISEPNRDYINSPPFIFHINGVAGFDYSQGKFCVRKNNCFEFDLISEPILSFSWEDEDNSEKRLFTKNRPMILKQMASGTDVLVVIGYSFPFFNRKFDKTVLAAMLPTLTKIYFQDPYNSGSDLINQFQLPKDIEIKHISNADSYFIPHEL